MRVIKFRNATYEDSPIYTLTTDANQHLIDEWVASIRRWGNTIVAAVELNEPQPTPATTNQAPIITRKNPRKQFG